MFFIIPKNLPTLLRDLLGHFAAGQEFDNSFLKVVLDFRGVKAYDIVVSWQLP